MTTFTWTPQTASVERAPRVRTAQFGDGYAQRVADGINAAPKKWALTFRALAADLSPAETFLAARGGVEAFDWTDPDGLAGKWVCKSWSATPHDALRLLDLAATFEQVFEY